MWAAKLREPEDGCATCGFWRDSLRDCKQCNEVKIEDSLLWNIILPPFGPSKFDKFNFIFKINKNKSTWVVFQIFTHGFISTSRCLSAVLCVRKKEKISIKLFVMLSVLYRLVLVLQGRRFKYIIFRFRQVSFRFIGA